MAAFHFAESEGLPRDSTGYANHVAQGGGKHKAAGAVGFGLGLTPGDNLRLAAAPALATPGGTGMSLSLWLRPADAAANGLLWSREDGGRRLTLALMQGRPVLRLVDGRQSFNVVGTTPLAGATWHHLGVVLGDRALLYLDGRPVGEGAWRLPEMRGDIVIGGLPGQPGLAAEIDELQIANLMRSADWMRASAIAQNPQSLLAEYGGDESGGGSDYLAVMRTLAGAVSLDGWVVIAIIVVMGLVAAEVVLVKSWILRKVARQNQSFLANYRNAGSALARMEVSAVQAGEQAFAESSLFRLWQAAQREMNNVQQLGGTGGAAGLSPQALEVLRAGVDASIVNEATRLNSRLVLLTLSVAGAPFLGLLGTVVGIMVTFGAIAMAGDVNVNTIAPGVAAALSTTVAGLLVAIPAMFGYNLLAMRVKELVTAMELFANELIGRLALQSLQDRGSAPEGVLP